MISPVGLGFVECRVRPLIQILGVYNPGRQSDADRYTTWFNASRGDRDLGHQLVHHAGDPQCTWLVGLREEEYEFLPADPANKIARPVNARGETVSESLEHFITDRMAIAIVVALEVVRIDDEKG